MSDFDEKVIERLKRLEREVERLQVKERPDKTGWIPVSDTWTYASATTINVPSGATSIYSVGMGIRLTANSVVKQAYIVKVENTRLTIAGDALTNHTFSAISYAPNPQTAIGFPAYFPYNPAPVGLTSPTYTSTGQFIIIGHILKYNGEFDVTNWTGQSGYVRGSLPVTTTSTLGVPCGTNSIYLQNTHSESGVHFTIIDVSSASYFMVMRSDLSDGLYWDTHAAWDRCQLKFIIEYSI